MTKEDAYSDLGGGIQPRPTRDELYENKNPQARISEFTPQSAAKNPEKVLSRLESHLNDLFGDLEEGINGWIMSYEARKEAGETEYLEREIEEIIRIMKALPEFFTESLLHSEESQQLIEQYERINNEIRGLIS